MAAPLQVNLISSTKENVGNNAVGSPEFFKKHSLPCAPWCILRLGGAYYAFLVHKYPIYRCSGQHNIMSSSFDSFPKYFANW